MSYHRYDYKMECEKCGVKYDPNNRTYCPSWGAPVASWKKCECGSEVTYGPTTNVHSFWCPKYKKPEEKP